MIHWGMDRNADYLQKYCELKGVKTLSDLKIPHIYKDYHETEVFQDFRDKFVDKGGYVKSGINWFFGGKYTAPHDAAQLIGNGGGFFKDVFGSEPNMVENRGIDNIQTFTRLLKEAITEKKAIGFSILALGSAHAMTIWGAKFDEYGEVCAIYYVDNNLSILGQSFVGILESPVGVNNGRVCMMNATGEIKLPIQDVDLLSLKRDVWEEFFRKQTK